MAGYEHSALGNFLLGNIATLTGNHLSFLSTEAMQNLHCMTISPTSATEVIVAGQQEIMIIVSLTRGVVTNEV